MLAQGPIELRHQLRRYRSTMFWLLGDSLRRAPWRAALFLGGGFLGAASQGGLLTVLLAYARRLEADETLQVAGMTLEARDASTLAIVALLTLVLTAASAGLIYISRRQVVALAIDYYAYCSKRVLWLCATSGTRQASPGFDRLRQILRQRSMGDGKRCGRALRTLLYTATPLLTVGWCTAYLLYLDWAVTLLLGTLIVLFLVFYYVVNRIALVNQKKLERTSMGAKREWLGLLDRSKNLPRWLPAHDSGVDEAYGRGELNASIEAYRQRLLAPVNADLVSNVLLAAGLVIVLAYLGGRALSGKEAWSTFIAYLFLLPMVLGATRSVFTSLVGFTRVYPKVRRYYEFVTPAAGHGPADGLEGLALKARARGGDFPRACWTARPGSPLGLVAPVELNRYTLPYFARCLAGESGNAPWMAHAIRFVTPRDRIAVPLKLRELLGIPAGEGWQRLEERLGGGDLVAALRAEAGEDLDQAVIPERWQCLKPRVRDKTILAGAVLDDAPILIVDAHLLARLTPKGRSKWMDALEDRIVVLYLAERAELAPSLDVEMVCVADFQGMIGFAEPEWVGGQAEKISKLIRAGDSEEGTFGEDEDDEDDV
jgi:hypothetical protein